ncbi:MAG: hypothetical protein A2268_14795 [Candidatus Raymondbacteria bacterium RifOxyA12_full_50_37]|uniref:Rhodanese domain-containing protein n=1 Tax=Candidatus Raymondbacteria bacterium RIFOXYD12_FULL_49_13 TaxID=1817890 RepID=A0A1F7F2H0_UNCRA|nr:MAG: hypothetical protein A2268_14795 [Candidatus Raymondbacteria bacterium RifOxyA12_full_50_37]OGJ87833.1 MAG: hypothetical protein A2350_12740 [Candidatus Raymondbacteria bacterium RifOxyB12_full_50_8]OGJ88687.1 MAG: hypothetical protein A2248_20730 [Candidatus Raymondbacteria bacterium RIFOXYA2_FULL_49_16]OGK00859.1 MAG: hypothetical protein A2519_07985 [Candidatus Raymondbacteria bacterium RIFOXYD12_FULL_49_13]OGP41724.1 MAG: hypothetical protein A2324_07820 [Candidatus Raymondbacteria 
MPELKQSLLIAVVLTAGVGLFALMFNALRPAGLPLFAVLPYETFVPCPEPVGEVYSTGAESCAKKGAFIIDARPAAEYEAFHVENALHVPFDYLVPVSREALATIARSRAKTIVVYGDGGQPDNGRELARELAGSGIKHVFFVDGGVAAIKKAKNMDGHHDAQ